MYKINCYMFTLNNLVPGPLFALASQVIGSANPLPEQDDNLLDMFFR